LIPLFIWFMAPNPCPLSIGSWLYCNTFFTFCSRFVQFFLKKLSFFPGGWGRFPVLWARWVYSQARSHAKKSCSSSSKEQLLPVKQMSDSISRTSKIFVRPWPGVRPKRSCSSLVGLSQRASISSKIFSPRWYGLMLVGDGWITEACSLTDRLRFRQVQFPQDAHVPVGGPAFVSLITYLLVLLLDKASYLPLVVSPVT
jgi:hypothetical protein